jgi:Resolvase, N terminal domain
MSSRFVAYYRVSTDRQSRSGLGLEAQRDAVMRHVASHKGELIVDFCEIESGKRSDRPQLAAAIASAKKAKATLIIAKLDRLARNVHFISGLMESGVDFVAADNPHANKLMVHCWRPSPSTSGNRSASARRMRSRRQGRAASSWAAMVPTGWRQPIAPRRSKGRDSSRLSWPS